MEDQIYKIRTDKIEILEKCVFKARMEEVETYNFEVKAQSMADGDKSSILILVSIEVTKLFEEPVVSGKITAGFGYVVENLKDILIKNDNNTYSIPVNLETLLKTISISTMRGIMYSEFRGTTLHRAILPIITADSLHPIEGNLL